MNGLRQDLEIKMALQVSLGILPVQWQPRFRTLVTMFVLRVFFYNHVLFIPDYE